MAGVASFVGVASAVLLLADTDDRRSLAQDDADQPKSCAVKLNMRDEVYVTWGTTSERHIEEYVLAPLRESVVDTEPQTYQVIGSIAVTYEDRVRRLVLFLPWGHIKEGEEYRIADLSGLKERIGQDFARQLEEIERYRLAQPAGDDPGDE